MKTILRILAPLLALAVLFPAPVQAEYAEGIEYRRITPAVEKLTDKPREVVELFWYGCPHCYRFEPKLETWVENKPDDVGFERVPAVFVHPQTGRPNPKWALHAKLFYTAELLEIRDKIHAPLFKRIHAGGKHIHTSDQAEAFFAEFGVDAETFRNTINSFAVDGKLRRAIELTKRYGAEGVPALVIDGRYITDGPMSGGHDAMLGVVQQLLATDPE
ncbi:thiol:disulfide interchange protein DsbA/DsbL [Thiohalophilus sp.]|uniref:thiol:disulfide interchange protein DsbA/DsbL n=1 Tax=Thiohalophilus sp. TaxID=3028392 RepID=UPI002ACEA585|nr:thiol:disulfide interchange protein DsbA/DsbL [Thiohalophilus sp.]MDZ7661349.1 thiol:disulfide interchange protein DsbA/DsbL [Thiohalophilus sp.]MDZ7803082.1 thiol:disulfide interchange protein DsbA/DsbL [Thiohalophilus sp.]